MTDFQTDKDYWHDYLTYYEREVFNEIRPKSNILEYGVLNGESIRYLMSRFPLAKIVGTDILPWQSAWPNDSTRVQYKEVDQGSRMSLRAMFADLCDLSFDLIIDDGSHQPEHQYNCLMESFPYVKSGGFYILEDVHTSYAQRNWMVNCFQVLLGIQHARTTVGVLNLEQVISLSHNSYFKASEIDHLDREISSIKLYKRTLLPKKCWHCKKSVYDYSRLQCACGTPLYKDDDSMSFVIRKG